MPEVFYFRTNLISMNILDMRKKKKLLKRYIVDKDNKLINMKKRELFNKMHSHVSIDLDDNCISCISMSKGGYQYILPPSNRKYLCPTCQISPKCDRCEDLHNGIINDMLKTYDDQTNLCYYCAYEYFKQELQYTPLEFKIAYTNLKVSCKECMKKEKTCIVHMSQDNHIIIK